MAVFNGYPYQPMYQPYTQPYTQNQNVAPMQPTVQPSVQGGLIWVSGEAGAKAYLVAPNNTVQLWDSEAQVIYLKSADASGMPSMKILDYTIRDSAKNGSNTAPVMQANNLSDYVTKDELKAVSDEISAIRNKMESMTRRRTREVVDDE